MLSRGAAAAVLAYILWGLLPVYWKSLGAVVPYEILCHRMVWSLIFTIGLIMVMGRLRSLRDSFTNLKNIVVFLPAATLLSVNWLLYIWAVNNDHVIESSLGYFINPLITVFFGMVFLKERLRIGQYAALLVALGGVVYLTVWYGQFPWVALSLACTFALYGLLHKKTAVPALEGLSLETMVLFVPALMVLLYLEKTGTGSFGHVGGGLTLLLIGTGVITSLPLLLFGYAAQNIPLSLLGLLQYIAPSINLVLGILLYDEPFPFVRMVGFLMIWIALLLYLCEGMVLRGRQKKALEQ
jgi:chloramphenicol-sensitive protein RarD